MLVGSASLYPFTPLAPPEGNSPSALACVHCSAVFRLLADIGAMALVPWRGPQHRWLILRALAPTLR
jgi:hypothetical protein